MKWLLINAQFRTIVLNPFLQCTDTVRYCWLQCHEKCGAKLQNNQATDHWSKFFLSRFTCKNRFKNPENTLSLYFHYKKKKKSIFETATSKCNVTFCNFRIFESEKNKTSTSLSLTIKVRKFCEKTSNNTRIHIHVSHENFA